MSTPALLDYADVRFTDEGIPHSTRFDDIYFSREGGLEESRHVYLQGNRLPQRWPNCRGENFQILETGFGTGLNFLLTLKAWQPCNQRPARLRYVAIEGFPLRPQDLEQALRFFPELQPQSERLLAQYPPPFRLWHRLDFGDVELLLIFDEAAAALPALLKSRWRFDAFYLDGFSPRKNPAMWQHDWLSRLHRLCRGDATLASFTVAGEVRRCLQAQGFQLRKSPGFGGKREMLQAEFPHPVSPTAGRPLPGAPRITLIGAGIAGCTLARVLAERGFTVQLIHDGPIGGTLHQHRSAIAGPRWSRDFSLRNRFQLLGLLRLRAWLTRAEFRSLWLHSGALDLSIDTQTKTDPLAAATALGLVPELVQPLDPPQALALAGVLPATASVFDALPLALDAERFCQQLLGHANIRARSDRLQDFTEHPDRIVLQFAAGETLDSDALIFCSGSDLQTRFPEFPTARVRGQLAFFASTDVTRALRLPLRFGNYLKPAIDGWHVLGGRFEHGREDAAPSEESHAALLDSLRAVWPAAAESFAPQPMQGLAGFRLTTPDRMPLCGPHPRYRRVWLNGAHGAQGLLNAFPCAELLASLLMDEAPGLPTNMLRALSPLRYLNP